MQGFSKTATEIENACKCVCVYGILYMATLMPTACVMEGEEAILQSTISVKNSKYKNGCENRRSDGKTPPIVP